MVFAAKELEQTQYGVNIVKGCATRDVCWVNKHFKYLFVYALLFFFAFFYLAGHNCLEGCVFAISDYQDCIETSVLDTWIEVQYAFCSYNLLSLSKILKES